MPPPEASPEQGTRPDTVARHTGLARRTLLVSVLTLVSRVLGFVREILSAALFGDRSGIFDAFITAWRVPNLFRRFLGEGALSTALQTELTKADAERGLSAGRALFARTVRLATWILLAVSLVSAGLVTLMPDAMPFTGWAWLGADPGPVRDLTLRVMPFLLFVCLSALVGGALQVRGHFAAPAWAPAVLNIVWIVSLLWIAAVYGSSGTGERAASEELAMTHALAVGVVVAGALQLVVQVPALIRMGLLGGARGQRGSTEQELPDRGAAWRVLKKSAPLALGAAVYQINVMIDGLMAEGLLPDGGPSLHYYANRVQQFPMALIAVAATSAVFPALQAHGQRCDLGAVRQLHDRTQRAICFIALPASLGLLALAEPVIRVAFEHGAFGAEGVRRASAALAWLTLAIVPAGASGLLARTHYALGDFRGPVRISIQMLVLNVALNLVCILGLGMDVAGLALATVLSSWGGLGLLYRSLGEGGLGLPRGAEPVRGALFRMLTAATAAGLAAGLSDRWLGAYVGATWSLLASIVLGIGLYFGLVSAMGVREARALHGRFRHRK